MTSHMHVKRSRITQDWARYLEEFSYDALPHRVVEQTKNVVLDTLGAMLAASSPKYPIARRLVRFAQTVGGRPESVIVGHTLKTSCVNAALVNGTFGYYCDIEPHHADAILHGPAVVVPAALVTGYREAIDGKTFIASVVLGIDVAARFSFGLTPTGQYQRGFHPSAVCGAFGAAASAGKVLGLTDVEFSDSIGLAALQASGLLAWESDPTEMSRPLNDGIAARNGVTAALLAKLGYVGPEVLEGKYDIFNAFSGQRDIDRMTRRLGRQFEVVNLAYKRYSCCAFLHPGIDAMLRILEENNIMGQEISEIRLRFPTPGAPLIDNAGLKSHNAQFVLATAAFRHTVTIDDILKKGYGDARIERLARNVIVFPDDELAKNFPEKYTSIVELTTRDRKHYQERVDFAYGTSENPMSKQEIYEKFQLLASTTASKGRAEQIVRTVERLEKLSDIRSLANLLRLRRKHAA